MLEHQVEILNDLTINVFADREAQRRLHESRESDANMNADKAEKLVNADHTSLLKRRANGSE
jgi:hypothetical protein